MTAALSLVDADHTTTLDWPPQQRESLLQGDILLQTRSHSAWGGAVTAQMYLPLKRSQVWPQLTNYPRWTQFFPDLTHSEVLTRCETSGCKRLYQAAAKAFLLFTAQVEIYLNVFESVHAAYQQIQFQLDKGSFNDFAATLKLQDFHAGTLLTYSVQATPTIPVPSQLIQQAMRLDLPANMRKMRQVLCNL
ncbi:SRPBCC family protein [Thermocoleostomius sinensis]|uniref:Cyclase n=1 Tax=Thermocoleostomius sinensis A174 TaxID=2016057 RepID=A0A9E8ZC55_9CYAN|nr:SRPBCC family protein [Thermocoleostomius sinensis]WAL60550.1 cyclase [Thermocoleostomius sinensis A174]